MTTTQAHSRSALWWYGSGAPNSCSSALCNILQGAVVPLMGKGQTRLWKSLFTASCLAVWSRSQQCLKWNQPNSHHLMLFFWMLAAVQWHQRGKTWRGKKPNRTKRGHLDPTLKNVCATCRTVQLSPDKKAKRKMFFNYLLLQMEFSKSFVFISCIHLIKTP